VRLDRGLLDTVRATVKGEPGLKLQDAFEEALTAWLLIREQNAAGGSVFFARTPVAVTVGDVAHL
jgi:hypothetical protein